MKVIRWVFFAIGLLVLSAVGVIYTLGANAAPGFSASTEIEIQRTAPEVWAFFSNPENLPKWAREIQKVERTSRGTWKFTGRQGDASTQAEMKYTVLEEGRRFRAEMVGSPQMVAGVWEFSVEPSGAGTRVRDQASLTVDSPWLRFGMKYLADMREIESAQLRELKAYLEKR
jgi:carbon monoxide dehydrogenase subunit G